MLRLDPDTQVLELEGAVVVRAGRYWVVGERLRLAWPRSELELRGPAWLKLCPCEDAPAQLRFQRLQLEPSGALELSQPVLELGGVPVLWAPWLRLEPPDHFALLPIEMAWRGRDGLFLGGGVHVPLGGRGETYAQVRAGAYTGVGFGLGLAVTTPSSASWVRWEQLDETGLWLDWRGAWSLDPALGVAWTVDAIRGPRGVDGTVALEPAARSSDRARASVGGSIGGLGYGLSLRADTRRGGPLTRVDSVGPELTLAYGAAVSEWLALDVSSRVQQLHTPSQAVSLFAQRAALAFAHPIAVLSTEGDIQLDSDARLGEDGWLGARLSSHLRLGLPLVRRSAGWAPARAEHWIEPFIDATAFGVHTIGRPDLGYFASDREGEGAGASAGVVTRYGTPSRREALVLELRAGSLRRDGRWRSSLSWRGGADSELARLSTDGVAAPQDRQWLSGTRLELGHRSQLMLAAYVEGRSGSDIAVQSLLDRDAEHHLWTSWFTTEGWTTGGELRVPVGQHWQLALLADADPTHERWLAHAANVEYRAGCRCLSLAANVQSRLGRGGVDVALSLDFTPR